MTFKNVLSALCVVGFSVGGFCMNQSGSQEKGHEERHLHRDRLEKLHVSEGKPGNGLVLVRCYLGLGENVCPHPWDNFSKQIEQECNNGWRIVDEEFVIRNKDLKDEQNWN